VKASLKKKDENMLKISKRRILRRIYDSIKENGIQRPRYNHELHKLYNRPDIVKVIKVGRLRSLGHLYRMQEQNPCRKLTVHKPEGTQQVGRPTISWLDSVDKLEMKVAGSGPMASNHKRGQGSSQTVVPTEEEEEYTYVCAAITGSSEWHTTVNKCMRLILSISVSVSRMVDICLSVYILQNI
jgi:hypothetical protein